jgi:hypothetical protein
MKLSQIRQKRINVYNNFGDWNAELRTPKINTESKTNTTHSGYRSAVHSVGFRLCVSLSMPTLGVGSFSEHNQQSNSPPYLHLIGSQQ